MTPEQAKGALRLLRYALQLRMYGERAPGGNETWKEFDQRCEALLREVDETDARWIPRTWVDVRRGDTVRLPGTEHTAKVAGVSSVLGWHVHPDADPYHPERSIVEWTALNIAFEGETEGRVIDPAKPVEILLTPAEVAAIEALGGWKHRMELKHDA